MRFRRSITIALLFVLLMSLVPLFPAVSAAPSYGVDRIVTSGKSLVHQDGTQFFVFGVNYEGYTDRAWRMWENGWYDPGLISADLDRAKGIGFNSIRIFVQRALADELRSGNFTKLDTVVNMASERGLYLVLTLYDYDDRNMAAVSSLANKIAAHYAGNPAILAYDLKNEPQYGTIAFVDYPSGVNVPLKTDGLIKQYGEKLSPSAAVAYADTGEGRNIIPRGISAGEKYILANNYLIYKDFLASGEAWVGRNPGKSTLDFMNSPEAAAWQPFITAFSDSLGAWIRLQSDAIRSADPSALTTVSYSNLVLAKLAANQQLSFLSPHRFSQLGLASLQYGFEALRNLQNTFPNLPILLSEFGYSDKTGDLQKPVLLDRQQTAVQESATWLHLYQNGFAGGMKWMLHNYTNGYNIRENNFGLFDDEGRAKPSLFSTKAIGEYIAKVGSGGRGNLQVKAAAGTAVEYLFRSPNGIIGTSGLVGSSVEGPVSVSCGGGGQVAAYWGNPAESGVYVVSTTNAQAMVRLGSLLGSWDGQRKAYLLVDGVKSDITPTGSGDISLSVDPYRWYSITPGRPAAFEPARSIAGDSAIYFPETQHNLAYGFKYYWERNGGLDIFGYPISEEFTEEGYTVQYFERARFEYHPEFKGTPYETELGLLGNFITAGRSFAKSAPFSNTTDRLYFPETGHSLSFGFKYYWEHHGGLPLFGYPISEEFQELNPADGKTYTVQYLERARFEYHPEFKGTPYETELGHLGKQWAAQKGWATW